MSEDPYNRRPLTKPEFDDRCRRFEELRDDLSQTSGKRSIGRNASIPGANPESLHLLGMARDYVSTLAVDGTLTRSCLMSLYRDAGIIGLYFLWHKGHLHVQAWQPKKAD